MEVQDNEISLLIIYYIIYYAFKRIIYNDISQVIQDNIKTSLLSLYEDFNIENALFIELPSIYRNNNSNYYVINQIFKISFMHIGGIKLGYLNANFPINNINYQSNYQVSEVSNEDNFTFNINFISEIIISPFN